MIRILGLLAAVLAVVVSLAGDRVPFPVVLVLGVLLVAGIGVALVRRGA